MKLSEAERGLSSKIKGIELDIKIKRRLQMLGMTHGTDIYVLNKKPSGPMIIKVRGTRFAIGRRFCEGIILEDR